MQFSFEFDAPRYCFLQMPLQKNKSSDYSVRNQDLNDFWFMHTCEKNNPLNIFDQVSTKQIQQAPVLRRSIIEQEVSLIEITSDPRITQNEATFQKDEEKQVQVDDVKQERNKKKMLAKTKRITYRKTEVLKQKKRDLLKPHSADKEQKPALNKMPARSKSNLPKINYHDIRPCPFPPRIQRQWQMKFAKKWYSLSPSSKIQAQKQMRQIQLQKLNKDKQSKIKENAFLRKEIVKKK